MSLGGDGLGDTSPAPGVTGDGHWMPARGAQTQGGITVFLILEGPKMRVFTGVYWGILGWTVPCWGALGCSELYWGALGWTGVQQEAVVRLR